MTNMAAKYGPWALVTGASSGSGRAFAERLAGDGVNLVVAARRLGRLEELANELTASHGVEVRPVAADLSGPEGVDAIDKAIADVDLAIVVTNAGTGQPGGFLRSPVETQLDAVRVNVTSPMEIAHRTGARLVARGRGAMIFTGSTSAFGGVPLMANYAATKAFVGTLAEGLRAEWRPRGVDVLVVHAGPTRTEMVQVEGVDFDSAPIRRMEPGEVADAALRSVGRRAVLVPGAANKVQRLVFTRLLPRRAATAIWGALLRRATDERLR